MHLPTEVIAMRYRNPIYCAAFSICRNAADAEDVVQETLLAYHTNQKEFETEQHLRAWLLRAAINRAKNLTRSFWHRNRVPLEDYMESLAFETPQAHDLFRQIMALPKNYRIAIHLFYYEDLSVREIAQILHAREGTVKVWLTRGRKLLKDTLMEEWNNDES